MFSAAYAADASCNDMNWKHERFNKLLIEARGEEDEAKRREMYVEMQRIVRDESRGAGLLRLQLKPSTRL